ncbi:MAG: carboxylesterase/lipase family protein [Acidimicrobiales bacterium]
MSEVVVTTGCGPVRGLAREGIARFSSIPYAMPPEGLLRFASAEPPRPWAKVRDCTRFSDICPQIPPSPIEFAGDPPGMSEDCLYLNVWAPWQDGDAAAAEAVLPVMVFVHGGSFTGGSGALSLYRGDGLASRGVVVVTFNYRLGALGWLGHPSLAGEDGASANFGLSDQIAALSWVQENIAAFGGDPDRVTVFGESAGAMAVAALMTAPAAQGLFRRAIMQSGAAIALGMGSGALLAEELAHELELTDMSLDALRAVQLRPLLAAQQKIIAKYEGCGLAFQPVVGERWLPEHPAEAIVDGKCAGIDTMIGTNRDEWHFFVYTTPSLHEIGEERLAKLVRRHAALAGLEGAIAEEGLIEAVRSARALRGESTEPGVLYSAIATDWAFRVPATRLAEAQSKANQATYTYLFDWTSPFSGGVLGSCHALELPFVFGTVADPVVKIFVGSDPETAALSEKMQQAWVSFACNGSPSIEGIGDWPAYEPALRSTMRLGPSIEVLNAPMEEERAWLSEALGPYGGAESKAVTRIRRLRPAR